MNIQINGMDKLQKILKDMSPNTYSAVEKELKIVCLDLQGKAQKLAPVDKGDLRGSAFTEVDGLDGIVGFEEPYALIQHENVGFRHPKGGQSKFLQQPYQENRNKYENAIITAAKKAVGA